MWFVLKYLEGRAFLKAIQMEFWGIFWAVDVDVGDTSVGLHNNLGSDYYLTIAYKRNKVMIYPGSPGMTCPGLKARQNINLI